MNKYLFMLGQSSQLAQEELKAVLSSKKDQIELLSPDFVLANTDQISSDLINNLGGTIKIAKYIQSIDNLDTLDANFWYNILEKNLKSDNKNHFGFSLYNDSNKNYQTLTKKALGLKKLLKEKKFKSRLVTSQESILSSVIVSKNKLIGNELLIIKHENKYILALTEAVQDFVAYGFRDMKRPHRDDKSGMLPPKVAQMMVNLAGNNKDKNILDPFCGSGTVLQEAALIGYENIYGSDISPKAVKETKENLKWLNENFDIKIKSKILESDIQNINKNINKNFIDLIVTEPFMGDARLIARQNKISDINKIKDELQELYRLAFAKFKKILSPDAIIVFIFPIFDVSGQDIYTLDKKIISQLGFEYKLEQDIIYNRPGQKVKRQITVWQNKK
ncbi:MAG: methyltransferase domain-containing protein [Candidatus Komeilibacteria bacterium]|jgi:tRNA G10  N-methylase Trm11|nr:methyltransferase domain-containing protein [Candidatus Komeilibacteria bacterium]MBT4447978.1 methyltransferase domain-containing protein [Candidatus Komeilibacteria bacterium]